MTRKERAELTDEELDAYNLQQIHEMHESRERDTMIVGWILFAIVILLGALS